MYTKQLSVVLGFFSYYSHSKNVNFGGDNTIIPYENHKNSLRTPGFAGNDFNFRFPSRMSFTHLHKLFLPRNQSH
jgi:hypothetical protein